MPARVDYASRFEFFRQACFALVRDRGVEALTRRSLAGELGCGVNTVRRLINPDVDLAVLAADEVVTRRRVGRWLPRGEEPLTTAGLLLRRLIPEDASRVDEELVWLRLTAAAMTARSGDTGAQLRREYQVATRGYADDEFDEADWIHRGVIPDPTTRDTADEPAAAGPAADETRADQARAHALGRHLEARQTEIRSTISQALELTMPASPQAPPEQRTPEQPTPEQSKPEQPTPEELTPEHLGLEALVAGLTALVCRGLISPEQAGAEVDRQLHRLSRLPG